MGGWNLGEIEVEYLIWWVWILVFGGRGGYMECVDAGCGSQDK